MVASLLTATLVAGSPASAAVCSDPQNSAVVVGGFEIDGNLCQNDGANIDWDTTPTTQPVAQDAVTTQGNATTDTTAFTSGASEVNGPNWPLASTQGTLSFGDRDIDVGRIYADSAVVGDNVYAFLGFERQDSGGAISVKVELNQLRNNDPSCGPPPGASIRPTPNPCRTPGDVLLVLDKQGGATPVTLSASYEWDGSTWQPLGNTGAVGRSNNGTITTPDGRVLRTQGVFGEIAVNLSALFGPTDCSNRFGTMNVRTSNSPSLSSALADWVAPTDLGVPSTCPHVVLQKHWTNGAIGDSSHLSINNAAQGAGESATSTVTTESGSTFTDTANRAETDVEPGSSVNLAETLAAGNTGTYNSSLSCDHGVVPDASGNITVPSDLGAGDTVTCTFTNTRRQATVTLTKAWAADSHAGDQALLRIETPDGTTGPTPSTAPTGTTITRTVFSGEQVTAVEELGEANVSSYAATTECGDNVDNLVPGDFGATFTVPNDPTDIACTITNTPVPAQLVLLKNWVNGNNGDTAGLTASIQGSSTTDSTTATVPAGGSGLSTQAASVPILAGQVVTLSETLPAPGAGSNSGIYQPRDLRCNGATIDFDTVTATHATGTFTIPAPVAPVTCEFTNEARYTIHLTKQWGPGSTSGDTAALTIANATANTTDTVTATAPDPPSTPASVTAASGDSVNLSEVLDKPGAYAATLRCDNGIIEPPVAGTSGSFVVPDDLTAGATITCTFQNDSRYTVQLTKAWGPGAAAGNTAHLTITNATTTDTDSVTATAPSPPGTPASVSASPGDSIMLDETFGAGDVPYDASLSCNVGRFTEPVPGTTGDFQVEPDLVDAGGTIICTFTNSRQQANVVLQKHWNNGQAGDSTDLSIDGATTGPGFATSTVPTGALPSFTDTGNQATAAVQTGDPVTVSETPAPGNTGSYDTALECDQGVSPDTAGTFTLPAALAGETVTCTFANTKNQDTLILQKHWNNGATGDAADLTITGGEPSPSPTTTSTVTDATGPSFTDVVNAAAAAIRVGDHVTLTENLPSTNTGSYDTVLSCTDGAQPDSTGSFTVTAAMVASGVTCTFTNTRQGATVVLRKHWNNGALDDRSILTIGGGEPNPSSPATSEVTEATGPSFLDETNQAAVAVQTGDHVRVSENLPTTNTGTYDTTLTCDHGVTPDNTGTFTVTAALAATTVTCTFTNTRHEATVVLQKHWNNAATGDRAHLTITGGDPSPSTATSTVTTATGPTFTDSANQAAAATLSGEQITLSESFPPGNNGSYSTALTCDNGVTPDASGTFTVTAALAATTITCTFTNARQAATLSITKTSTAAQIAPGAQVPYTLTVRNTGPGRAQGVVVTDTLPQGLSFVSSTPTCTASGRAVTCNLGTIAVGGVVTVRMTTRAANPFPAAGINQSGNAVNQARVTSPVGNCPPGSTDPACTARRALPVRTPTPPSRPAVTTTTSRGQVTPGQPFRDAISVRGLRAGQSASAVAALFGPFRSRAAAACTAPNRVRSKNLRVRNGVTRTTVVRIQAPGVYTWRVRIVAGPANRAATHSCRQAAETTVVARPAYRGPAIRGGFTGVTRSAAPAVSAARVAGMTIRMAAIGMNARLVPKGIVRGHMVLPPAPRVGWLRRSAHVGDRIGSVVVGGHVSNRRDVPGAMFRLRNARSGQLVTITRGGTTFRYRVTGRAVFSRTRRIPQQYFRTTGPPRLVMVSCTGRRSLPRGRFTYTQYIIVVARQLR